MRISEIFLCFLNTISLLDTLGLKFVLLHLDADDPSSVKESAKKVGSLLGNNGLNLLVNNAGIVANGTIQTSSVEDMKNTFNTNVIGPLLIIRVMLCIKSYNIYIYIYIYMHTYIYIYTYLNVLKL